MLVQRRVTEKRRGSSEKLTVQPALKFLLAAFSYHGLRSENAVILLLTISAVSFAVHF
jgi:hypothetical protein